METTQTPNVKYWPDAKVPEGAVYIGNENDGTARYDYYVDGSRLFYTWGHDSSTRGINEVLAWGKTESRNWGVVATLILAHQQKHPHPPARATTLTREQMVEAAAKAAWNAPTGRPTEKWDGIDESVKSERRIEQEAALLAIGAIQPLPKPAPVPEKTAETPEEMAKRYLRKTTDSWTETVFPGFRFHNQNSGLSPVGVLAHVIREAQSSALTAQADAHRRELEALRERCVNAAGDWYTGTLRNSPSALAYTIRAVPLTKAEAKP